MLTLFAQTWDIRGLAYDFIILLACIVLIGIVISIPAINKYVSWVPQWFWALISLVVIVVLALWALRNF